MATKKIEEIKTHPLFEGLFTINDDLLARIEQNMREEKYDESLDEEDNEECADDNADNEGADESQNEDEDDEEYFDPVD